MDYFVWPHELDLMESAFPRQIRVNEKGEILSDVYLLQARNTPLHYEDLCFTVQDLIATKLLCNQL